MDNYTKELIKKAHDVKCPKCGTQAKAVFVGESYYFDGCAHDEVQELIQIRENRMTSGFDESTDS